MLEKMPWIFYSDDIMLDYRHCIDEGKKAEEFEEECLRIKGMPRGDEREAAAGEMYSKLSVLPVSPEFPYNEPSDLTGIKALCPLKPELPQVKSDELTDKIKGAWLGRVSGCLLGKPIEGWNREGIIEHCKEQGNFPLTRYLTSSGWEGSAWVDTIGGVAPVDDDTNYTALGLKIIEQYGRDFISCDVAEAWLTYLPYGAMCTAERVAYKNFASGIFPPESASYKNPFREWIGAQIRADFFGYINPGKPEIAAEMAFRDACVSHVKNGIYGEMFVAAMLAAAAVTDDIRIIIETGLGEIPKDCRLSDGIKLAVSWYESGISLEEALDKIHERYNENYMHDWCHTVSNAMIVVLSLLFGKKDIGASMCMAAMTGFDTDCNAATVGSISGMAIGARNIPEEWIQPYNNKLRTSIDGYNLISIDEFAEKTMQYIL